MSACWPRANPPMARPLAWAPPSTVCSVMAVATSCSWSRGQHVALVALQALAVFQQHQFLGRIDCTRGCRSRCPSAHPGCATRSCRRCRHPGWPRCWGRCPPPRRFAQPHAGIRPASCGWHAPGTSARRPARDSSSHSTGRWPLQARQASTSAVCSAMWMWIGRRAPSMRLHDHATACVKRGGWHGAQRMRSQA
jgi:hypothetical protein